MRILFILCALGLLEIGSIEAQAPAPVTMQAATPVLAGSVAPVAGSAATASDTKDMMQLLQAMEATNAETIKKQEAALQTLDALQKAAEEIKIFSKRG